MNNNANLIRKLLNNSWEQPALTLEQAKNTIAEVEAKVVRLTNHRGETPHEQNIRIEKFLSQYGANGRYV